MAASVLGIVGGSGFYNLRGLRMRAGARRQSIRQASDEILFCGIDGLPIRFLPRHGRGHKVPPSAIKPIAPILMR